MDGKKLARQIYLNRIWYIFLIKNLVRSKFISSLIVLNIIFWPGFSSKIEDMLNVITDQGST